MFDFDIWRVTGGEGKASFTMQLTCESLLEMHNAFGARVQRQGQCERVCALRFLAVKPERTVWRV